MHEQQNNLFFKILVKLPFEWLFLIIYTYKKCGDDNMNLEKAPSNIRAIAASLWIIPAIILSYLFQNRAELFFLEIIYISALFSSIGVGFSELPFGKIFTVASILPCIANSYYFILLFPFNFQAPSLVDILKFVFFIYSLFYPRPSLYCCGNYTNIYNPCIFGFTAFHANFGCNLYILQKSRCLL